MEPKEYKCTFGSFSRGIFSINTTSLDLAGAYKQAYGWAEQTTKDFGEYITVENIEPVIDLDKDIREALTNIIENCDMGDFVIMVAAQGPDEPEHPANMDFARKALDAWRKANRK